MTPPSEKQVLEVQITRLLLGEQVFGSSCQSGWAAVIMDGGLMIW